MTDHSKGDFVLQGRGTPLLERPDHQHSKHSHHSASQHPSSSRRGLYSQGSHIPLSESLQSSDSSAIQADVSTTSSSSLPKGWPEHEIDRVSSMQKSVTFTQHRHGSGSARSHQSLSSGTRNAMALTVNGTSAVSVTNGANGLVNGDVSDSDHSGSLKGVPKSPEEAQWYTHPVHLEKKAYATFQEAGVLDHVLPTKRSTGTVGVAMAADKLQNGQSLMEDSNGAMATNNQASTNHHHQRTHQHQHRHKHKDTKKDSRLAASFTNGRQPPTSPPLDSSMDFLAKEFFPITLGAAYTLNNIQPNKSGTLSPPAKGLVQPNAQPWIGPGGVVKPKRSKSPSRKSRGSRPGSGHSSSSSASKSSLDKVYLMTAEAPNIGSAPVLLSSPYQCELARLRMERLRIEEDHLLEVKRQDEMERIRGPSAKWYELKTPRFHYEAKKNTELLKNKGQWQELMDYRNELERASKEFQQNYTSQHQLSSTT